MNHVRQVNIGRIFGASRYLVGGIDSRNRCADPALTGFPDLSIGLVRILFVILHGAHYSRVAGTAAQIAHQRFLYFLRSRVRLIP